MVESSSDSIQGMNSQLIEEVLLANPSGAGDIAEPYEIQDMFRRVGLGPVYTTVEKSTGHEKKGVSQL